MQVTQQKALVYKKPTKRGVWTALIGLVCLCLAGCQVLPQTRNDVPAGLAAEETPSSVRVEGRLVPHSFVSLSPSKGGRSELVLVQEGLRVQAGDLLVQLEGHETVAAEIAAAQLELILAEQRIELLYKEAEMELAQVEQALAEAAREQAFAQDGYESLAAPIPQQHIDQARVNMMLSENQLESARHDLEKAQKRFANKNSIIWRFINQRQFKLRITLLEAELADRQRHYQDAQEKYQDLLNWPDAIDLALAETRLEAANAVLQRLLEKRDELSNGPDADDLELALASRKAAESRLAAAQIALASKELRAPMDGMVVELNAKPGEWLPSGPPAVVLADLDQWVVETEDLSEALAPELQPGQPVTLMVDAIPGLYLDGSLDHIDLLYTEDDDEIYYTADITTSENDPRLRWGMTVWVEIEQPLSNE